MESLGKAKEWSRSLICKPKDNLTTEAGLRAHRQALARSRNRDDSQKNPGDEKAKVIKNDFDWWLKLRKTNKSFCSKG